MNDALKNEGPQTIIDLRIKNIKRIQAVSLHPDGRPVVVIGGNNAQGKSSVLDSIMYAMGGKKAMPEGVVRDGEIRGEVRIETQNWIIDRKITVDGKASVEIKHNGDLQKNTPQKLLDDLCGTGIAFDPESFAKLDRKKQAETLRSLVGLDLTGLDAAHARAFDQRTEVNRDVKRLEGLLSTMVPHGGVPKEEASISNLLAELGKIREANGQRAILATQVDGMNQRRSTLQAEIDRLHLELDLLNNRVQVDQLRLDAMPIIDEAPLAAQVAACEVTNRKIRENAAYHKVDTELQAARTQAEALSGEIKDLANDRARQIAACAMPVVGLGFNEAGEVTYQRVILAECSAAERLIVAVAIGIALNPTLAVLLLRDGSLLDKATMRVIYDMAKAAGAQVWTERVTEDEAGAIIIEDGCVKG